MNNKDGYFLIGRVSLLPSLYHRLRVGDNDFAEVAYSVGGWDKAGGFFISRQHGKGEHVGGCVLTQVFPIQFPHPFLAGDDQTELGLRVGLLKGKNLFPDAL